MSDLNLNNTTLTNLANTVPDFTVPLENTDGTNSTPGETTWYNSNWPKYLGYYKKIPELQKALGALGVWAFGKGWSAEEGTEVNLDNIIGWGEDSFSNLMWNMMITKKINGDAYAEIVRNKDTGRLINLKPLDPASMVTVVASNGTIKRYEQISKINKNPKKFKKENIFHIANDRIADEIHGTSIMEACQWVIDARNEAMNDWRRISHRSTVRVLYIDQDNTAKLQTLKNEYADAIKKGEVMIIPAKKGDAEFTELSLPPVNAFLEWIQYLENFFYQAVGVPRVIATSENFTESSSKIGFLTFEPVYTWEQVQMEKDLWNQLAIKVVFNRPPSLSGELQQDEAKDGPVQAAQPNDVQAGVGE